MIDQRYKELWDNWNDSNGPKLTEEEFQQGWHFCYEFDGLLRNSNEEDFKCTCTDYQNLTNQPKHDHSDPTSPKQTSDGS